MQRSGRQARRAAVLHGLHRDLVRLAALLVGEPDLAPHVVASARVRGRSPEALPARARLAVLRTARRTASPWTRRDPLAAVPPAAREVLALRATTDLSVPAVAHLLDVPVGAVLAREEQGLAAAGYADLPALRAVLESWLAQVPLAAAGEQPAAPRVRSGLAAAALAVVAVLALVLPDAVPGPAAVPQAVRQQVAPRPARPSPGCATGDDLCLATPSPSPRAASPVAWWPFADDRAAADWAVEDGGRSWAADPVEVARRAAGLLRLRGVRVRAVGGGLVALRADGVPAATVRLVRLGRGARRPWSVVSVRSPGLVLTDPGPLAPATPVTGTGSGALRLLAPDGAVLAAAPALGAPLPWARPWTAAAVVAQGPAGLALQAVRRAGDRDPGVPAPGTAFLTATGGSVRLHDALSGEQLLQVSGPTAGARDSDPGRGGRDGVVFVRTEADGCTTTVLRAALDRGAGGTTVQRAALRRRLPRLSPSAQWLGWVEQPCGGGPGALVLRGPDARVRRVPVAAQDVDGLDVRDDGGAVVQLRSPDRAVVLAPGATALPAPLPVRAGCRATAAAAAGDAVLVWERCGPTATPVLLRGAARTVLGRPGRPVATSAVVVAPDGPLVLARTADGAVARLVAGRLVDVLAPCLRAPGCATSADW